jgi:tetratricopeptide (TPR) repeat protein
MATVKTPAKRRFATLALALGLVIAGGIGGWVICSRQPDGPIAKAHALYKRGDWQGAWNAASERLKVDPNDFDALLLSARSTARLGRDSLAQSIYDSRIGMDRMQGEDYLLLAAGLSRQDKAPMARVALETGLKVDPNNPELIQELTRLNAGDDNLAAATDLASRLVGIPGWEARGELLLGVLRGEQSDPLDSALHIERALSRDPQLKGAAATPTQARKMLARVQLQSGEAGLARKTLGEVLAAGQDDEAQWLLSRACLLEGDIAGASAAVDRSHGFRDEASDLREPAPYVGAAKCGECHAAIYGTQQKSLHSRTFTPTAKLGTLPLPDHPLSDALTTGATLTYKHEGDQLRAEARFGDRTYRALVEYAIGSADRGMTFVGRDDNGTYRELRMSRYNDGSGWDRTTGHPLKPDDPSAYLGQPLSADSVRRCLHCHTTDAHTAAARIEPTAADRSIGCERCHGPGGAHVKAIESHFPDIAIARPQLFSAPKVIQLCGQCHSPRGAGLGPIAEKSDVRFQSATLVRSRCYTESAGKLSCLTCHNPHRDAETSPAYYETKCLSCHTASQGDHVPQRLSCPVNPKSGCLECHMPVVKNALPHSSFSDHHIRIRRETP